VRKIFSNNNLLTCIVKFVSNIFIAFIFIPAAYAAAFDGKTDYNLATEIALVSLVILIVFIVWNRYLFFEVKLRRKTEKELQKLKDVLDQTLDCVFMFDGESLRFSYVNDGARKQIGYTTHELKNMHPFDIKPDISTEEFRDMIFPLMAHEKESLNFETVHQHKNGKRIDVEIFLQYIKKHSNFIAIVRDITERKKIQQVLKESQESYQEIAGFSPVGIFRTDAEGKNIYSNKRCNELTGLNEKESYGSGWISALHPEERETFVEEWKYFTADGIPFKSECRLLRKNGSVIWAVIQSEALRDNQGIIIGFIGAITDITKEKLIDIELEKSNSRFKAMLESIPDAIVYANPERNIEMVNDATLSMFGYQESELIGNKTQMLYASTDDYNQQGHERYNLNTEELKLPYEVLYKTKNDNRFIGETLGTVVKAHDGEVLGFLGIIRDVTDRKDMEYELKEYRDSLETLIEKRTFELINARDEAERANKAKSEFLSSMSHELRTPLNAILGFGQMLELEGDNFNKIQKRNVKEILDAGHHLLNLINEVLNLAQIESGKLEINMEDVELGGILNQCFTLMKLALAEKNIKLVDEVSDQQFKLHADSTRLKQVLLNILSNAVKYNKNNGRITIASQLRDNNYVRICISDTGKGLNEKELARLFVPFERLNAKENVEGTGIGLTITKHLCELMDGVLGVNSSPNEGSTFWFELRLV